MISLQIIFDVMKIALSLGFLTYASWSDYKTREVSNTVWAYYAPVAIGLTLTQLLLYQSSLLPLLAISVGVTVAFALLLFYSGAFGGADSKALICIALALPFAPITLFMPFFAGGLSPIMQTIYPITVFSNAVLFAAAAGIYMVVRNVVWHKRSGTKMFAGTLASESIGRKILILITSYRMPVSVLKEKWHVFPMEDVEEGEDGPKRKLVVIPREEGRDKIVERLSNAVEAGRINEYVWATPGLPMLIFVTLGLVVALFFGDIVWLLVRFVLG